MKVFVTGATGFIGSHVVEQLQERGHEVRALARTTSDTAHLRERGVELATGDVTDPGSLEAAAAGMDAVIHTAAVVGNYGNWEHFERVGVKGTQNVVDAAAASGARRFVHLGSIAVYGTRPHGRKFTETTPFDTNPEGWNHYVREKVLSEQLIWQAHDAGKVVATSVRPSVVVGPRDRNAVPRALDVIRSPLGSLAGKGNNCFPVVVVEELAAAIVDCMESPVAEGKAYNFSGKQPITQREFMNLCAEAAGLKPMRLSMPEPVAMAGAASLELLWRTLRKKDEPFITRIVVAIAGRDYDIDCSLAERELGWKGEADYAEAIRRGAEWWLAAEGRSPGPGQPAPSQ